MNVGRVLHATHAQTRIFNGSGSYKSAPIFSSISRDVQCCGVIRGWRSDIQNEGRLRDPCRCVPVKMRRPLAAGERLAYPLLLFLESPVARSSLGGY